MPVEAGEPRRAVVSTLLLLVALVGVPVLAAALAITVVGAVAGDDEAVTSAPVSTVPEQPGTTVVVPGGSIALPVPGGVVPGAEPSPPPGWPAALEPPEEAVIVTSVLNGSTRVLVWGSDQEVAALADQVKVQLVAGGFTIATEVRAPDGSSAVLRGVRADQQVSASIVRSQVPGQPPRVVNMVLTPL